MRPRFASGTSPPAVGDRQHGHVERAFAERAELAERLHERAVRVDLDFELPVRALLDFGGEFLREPVAEVTVFPGRRRELMRDLEHLGRLGRNQARQSHTCQRHSRCSTQYDATTTALHLSS
jgi:hypothetical protein